MRYAWVFLATNIVVNTGEIGDDVEWVQPEGYLITPSDTANVGDLYDPETGLIAPPPPPPPPVLTPEELREANFQIQRGYLYVTSESMVAFFRAIDLGSPPSADEIALASIWQKYYRDVMAIDLTLESPSWPSRPI